ncbi:uncharacterized protein GIQ15_06904 [Arthroderma uncinatum]|uniref:uncharacterized protein n=1 Tax=Arthroderma uncinatum TaxID=74035 RepID=UPI00144A9808|nr:uncharacterized protein GIQ15_06904 [Arthroderma uncinatum]KAF3479928.1 hypothetical protein GIQ15_06904 [Arthroderma uncinatum]
MNHTPAKTHRTPEDEYPVSARGIRQPQSESRTPRFLLGPPASQGSNIQFASTPRFLFGGGGSQSQANVSDDEINQDDQEDYSGRKRPARRLGPPVAFRGEAIRDSDSESIRDDGSISSGHGDDVAGQAGTKNDGDEDEMLLSLSPVVPSAKRRRRLSRSPSPKESRARVSKLPGPDNIISSSPGSPPSVSASEHMDPPSDLPEDEFVTPSRREMFPSSGKDTQGLSSARYARFIANPRQAGRPTSGDQACSQAPDYNATTALESTPRPKPRFVLPSTPHTARSDKQTGPMTSPTPCSPLAHRTKRGRASSLVKPNFVPNGMAAEVRNWIFEMGAKCQVNSHSPTPGSLLFSPTRPTQSETKPGASQVSSRDPYHLTTKVALVKHSLQRSGEDQLPHTKIHGISAGHPAPFILATLRKEMPDSGHLPVHKILLFNTPLHATPRNTVPGFISLKGGDCIGIRKGLVWEMEMNASLPIGFTVREGDSDTAEEVSQTCLVGVEWDILD